MSNPNGSTRSLIYRAQPNPAIHRPGQLATPVELTLFNDGKNHGRHAKQLCAGKIAALNSLPGLIINATEYCACYQVDTAAQASLSINGEQVFQPHLYLFSMLIAFEWQPSPHTVQQVQSAVKQASNFLYDVTDGFMAIGQAILSGPDLLDVADIQVMASNRFHPRSWISALHEPHKFQPIRLGRGLWRKDQGFVVPWDESDSPRVLVHEWGHYALELVDEYLNIVHLRRSQQPQRQWNAELVKNPTPREALPDDLDIIAPSIALPIDSIMSTLASSELIPRHGSRTDKLREYMQGKISNHFPNVSLGTPLDGPTELPLPDLPVFKQRTPNATPEEVELSIGDMATLRELLIPSADLDLAGSSWVYLLKPDLDSQADRIIGQGVFSERDWEGGFGLYGAAAGDQVVVVAHVATRPSATQPASWVKVIRGNLVAGATGEGVQLAEWEDVTPRTPPDFIDVLPAEMRPVTDPGQSQLPTQLRVQIETRDPLPEVFMCALGQAAEKLVGDPNTPTSSSIAYPEGRDRTGWVSDVVGLHHLDGHVLLRWADGTMYICGYSHGGGPCTGGGGYCVCYTAGSYEGNSMLFYRDNYDASDRPTSSFLENKVDDEGTRVVSTVMHGGQQYLEVSPGDFAEARSYIFSLGSNQPLKKHSATLVLYYDNDARKQDGDLLVYRWRGNDGWQRLTTYAPENRPYLCIPLDEATPETSGGANGRGQEYFDRYRIYWTPRT
jgi:hypothetical protein